MEAKKASIHFENDITMKTIHAHNKSYKNFVSKEKVTGRSNTVLRK